MNKAAVYDRYGAPGALELRDLPMSPLQAGELLVKVVAAAVNPVDWKIMRGDFRLVSGRRFPRLIGADFSGTVATVGAGVADYAVGDAVFGTINPLSGKRGCLAEFIVVQPAEIVRKPENVSFADAATLPIAGVSALDCLDRLGQAQRGQRLLVTGAAGGVGAFIVQLAKLNGLHVTGVCRECNGEWVCGLGADTIIAHDREGVHRGCPLRPHHRRRRRAHFRPVPGLAHPARHLCEHHARAPPIFRRPPHAIFQLPASPGADGAGEASAAGTPRGDDGRPEAALHRGRTLSLQRSPAGVRTFRHRPCAGQDRGGTEQPRSGLIPQKAWPRPSRLAP